MKGKLEKYSATVGVAASGAAAFFAAVFFSLESVSFSVSEGAGVFSGVEVEASGASSGAGAEVSAGVSASVGAVGSTVLAVGSSVCSVSVTAIAGTASENVMISANRREPIRFVMGCSSFFFEIYNWGNQVYA